jgi:hypothetical protein
MIGALMAAEMLHCNTPIFYGVKLWQTT